GKIVTARADFCTQIPQRDGELRWSAAQGGGAVMDLGCYPVHALRSLIGAEPRVEKASAVYLHGVAAEASAQLAFPDRVNAEMHCSMVASAKILSLEVVGDRGGLALSNYIAPQFGCVLSMVVEGAATGLAVGGVPSSYAAQLAHVVAVLRGGGEPLTG